MFRVMMISLQLTRQLQAGICHAVVRVAFAVVIGDLQFAWNLISLRDIWVMTELCTWQTTNKLKKSLTFMNLSSFFPPLQNILLLPFHLLLSFPPVDSFTYLLCFYVYLDSLSLSLSLSLCLSLSLSLSLSLYLSLSVFCLFLSLAN